MELLKESDVLVRRRIERRSRPKLTKNRTGKTMHQVRICHKLRLEKG